jgi:small-conductance mechanosensitive channel/CRP-like cAMP-binding protein
MFSALAASESLTLCVASVPVVYLAVVAIGRTLKRRHGVHLSVVYQFFCIALALWAPLFAYVKFAAVPPDLSWLKSEDDHIGAVGHLGAVLALLGALVFTALIRRFYWELWFEKSHKTRAPRFLSDLATLFIFVTALLAIVHFVYKRDIAGLALGSTVVAAILGFALQDLLGNIIAGISLEIGKPFRTGDWLIIDQQHAEVIEVNWRSTRLRTNDDIYVDLPNKLIVGSKIVNLTYPTRQHALRLQVGFDVNLSPNVVKDCLSRAAANAQGVLSNPSPRTFLKDFGDYAIFYEVKFWIEDESQYNNIVDSIRTNIWYEAQRNRLRMPFPIRTLQIERHAAHHTADDNMETARICVRKQPFFQLLEEEQIDEILRNARVLRFGRGERVIEQGANGHSMFILLDGEADVFVHAGDHEARVATLRSGDYCGEMSLLTGEPRSATVVARLDCEMCEIEKNVFGAILQENEALVQKLGELLAHRRMENEGILASTASHAHMTRKQAEYTEGFLKRLSSFFEL